jgi:hypothetical protein
MEARRITWGRSAQDMTLIKTGEDKLVTGATLLLDGDEEGEKRPADLG